jgi:hypothetical protein
MSASCCIRQRAEVENLVKQSRKILIYFHEMGKLNIQCSPVKISLALSEPDRSEFYQR